MHDELSSSPSTPTKTTGAQAAAASSRPVPEPGGAPPAAGLALPSPTEEPPARPSLGEPVATTGLPAVVRRPRIWTLVVAYAAALGVVAATGLVLLVGAVVVTFRGETPAQQDPAAIMRALSPALHSPWTLVIASFLVEAGLLVLLGACVLLSPEPWRKRLSIAPARLGAGGYALAIGAFLCLSTGIDGVCVLTGASSGGALRLFNDAFASAPPVALLLALLTVGLMPGVAEEGFCRGYLQTRLLARWGRWPAIAVTSVAFAALHLDPAQAASALGIGLWLGWLAERCGSIIPGVVLHAINNGVAVLSARLLGVPEPGWPVALLTALSSVLAALLLWRLAVRLARTRRWSLAVAAGGGQEPNPAV